MNYIKSTGVLILLILAISCNNDRSFKTQDKKLAIFQTAEFEIVEGFEFFKKKSANTKNITIDTDEYVNRGMYITDISDKSSYVVLETRDNVLIGSVDALFWNNDHWFISDAKLSKCVYKFSPTGKFISKIGGHGQGPGEYMNPSNVSIDSDKLFIHSEFQGRIFIYDQNGVFQQDLRVPFLFDDFHHMDNHFLFNTFNRTNGHISTIANQMIVSTDDSLNIEGAGYYFDPEVFMNMRTGYEDRIAKYDNEFFYMQPFDNELSVIDQRSSQIIPVFNFDFGDSWPSHKEIKTIIKRTPEYLRQELMNRGFSIIEDFRVGKDHILIKVLYHSRLISLLISKETGEVTGGIAWIDNLDKLPGIQPAYLIDNKIVSIIEVPYLLEAVAEMDKTSADYHNLLKKIPQLESIRPSDNVVLRIHELN